MGLPPGIQLYTVREDLPKDTPGTLKQLHEIGFREVETAGFGKYTPAEFRKLLDDNGLKAPSAHVDLSGDNLDSIFDQVKTLGGRFRYELQPLYLGYGQEAAFRNRVLEATEDGRPRPG